MSACATGTSAAPARLDPGAWVDAATLQGTAFAVPVDHAIAASMEDGRVMLTAVPLVDHPLRAPATECMNDVPSSRHPLTANHAAPVLSRAASRGECDGARGADGPVSYVSFHTSGEGGGALVLWSMTGSLSIGCDGAVASVGAGVGEAWVTSLDWGPAYCWVWMVGDPPSQWSSHQGHVDNWGRVGSTYGLVVI